MSAYSELFDAACHSAATSAEDPEAEARRLINAYRAEALAEFQMSDARELTARYRAEVLNEAADVAEQLRTFDKTYSPSRKAAQVSENVGKLAVAAELRRLAEGAGQAGLDTAPRCENPKCGRPITRGAQWCSTWCHQASDTQAGKDTPTGESTQPTEQPYTEARAAFMQIGTTSSLDGLRTELHIDGHPPLVGRYYGAGMRRAAHQEGVLIIEPLLAFEYTEPVDGGDA